MLLLEEYLNSLLLQPKEQQDTLEEPETQRSSPPGKATNAVCNSEGYHTVPIERTERALFTLFFSPVGFDLGCQIIDSPPGMQFVEDSEQGQQRSRISYDALLAQFVKQLNLGKFQFFF